MQIRTQAAPWALTVAAWCVVLAAGLCPASASVDRTISSDREIGGSGSVQFTLDEKSKVTFDYDARANVEHRNMFRIRIYGRSPSGGWRNLETIVHIFAPDKGTKTGTLPAGTYKVLITSRKMSWDVTIKSTPAD